MIVQYSSYFFLFVECLGILTPPKLELDQTDMFCLCLSRIIAALENDNVQVVNSKIKIIYPAIYINTSKEILLDYNLKNANLYVINIDDMTDYTFKSFTYWKFFNPGAKFFVLTSNFSENKIFAQLSIYYAFNIVVINIKSGAVATYSPFAEENMFSEIRTTIGLGNIQKWKKIVKSIGILNKSTSNYWRNTSLEMMYYENLPYLYLANGRFRGFYYRYLEIIKDNMKFNNFNLWPSKSSSLKDLRNKTVINKIMGLLNLETLKKEPYMKYDIVPFYFPVTYYWIVPQAELLTFWKRFLKSTNPSVVLLLFGIFWLSVFIWSWIERYTIQSSYLLHLQLILEVSNDKIPKIQSTSGRCLIFGIVFSFFLMSTMAKVSIIKAFFHDSYESQITSLKDIIEHKLQCNITVEIKNIYQKSSDREIRDYVQSCSTHIDEENTRLVLAQMASIKNIATVSRKENVRREEYTLFKKSRKKWYHIIRHPLVKHEYLYMYLRKGLPFYQRFYNVVLRMHDNGLAERTMKKFRHRLAFYDIEHTINYTNLTLKQSLLAFNVLMTGHAINLVAFVIEYIVFKIQNICKPR